MYYTRRAVSVMNEAKERQQYCESHLPMTLRSNCILSPVTGVRIILSDFKVYEQMPELQRSNIHVFKQSGFEINER
jgi:hypothetical protein